MINPKHFVEELEKNNVNFFCGVPDSLLKHFCSFIENVGKERHVISANEGGAVATAAGHYLATGNIALAYMQNSGLGNSINPLVSITDPKVYGIPMILLIGWRGEEGLKDEPQHEKQGEITIPTLDSLGVNYEILTEHDSEMSEKIKKACNTAKRSSSPFAFIVRKGTFEPCENNKAETSGISREEAITKVLEQIKPSDVIISTTGKLSRELFELKEKSNSSHEQDFMMVGGMGHASSVALGIALSKPEKNVFCFDGDGASIMHLGSWGVIGQKAPKNFKHILFNNSVHDSVGGQPTAASNMNFTEIAKSCGYKKVFTSKTKEEISDKMSELVNSKGPSLLEIVIKPGARKDLGRPGTKPRDSKESFMKFLKK